MFVINSRKVLTVNRQCGDVILNVIFLRLYALRELHYVSMQDLDATYLAERTLQRLM